MNEEFDTQECVSPLDREMVKHRQEIRIKDNTIRDLQASNTYLHGEIDRLLVELAEARNSSISAGEWKPTNIPSGSGNVAASGKSLLEQLTIVNKKLADAADQLKYWRDNNLNPPPSS